MKQDTKGRIQPETIKELFELIAKDKGTRLVLIELGEVSIYFSSLEEKTTIELLAY